MARAATTSDVFNAIAEPRRRGILALLQRGEHSAGDLATALGIGASPASKHLRVLREVGLVVVREEGRQRYYRLDASGLREVHAWAGGFERFWSESFERLEAYAMELERGEEHDGGE